MTMTTDTPTSNDLDRRANAIARSAVDTGQPVPITYHGRPYVRLVPEDLWNRAFAALQREEGREAPARVG